MEIYQVKIKEIKRAKYNPRSITENQYKQLKKSIEKFGFVQPVVLNSYNHRAMVLIGGHRRLDIWEEMGHDTVPAVYVDLDEKQERELNIRLNKNTGQWDFEILANEFDIVDLTEFGFEGHDLKMGKFWDGGDEDEPQPDETKPFGSPVLKYEVIFKTQDDHDVFMNFIKSLRETYPDHEMISERIIQYIRDHE